MANPNYDAILSTTLANYRGKLEDNVFSNRPVAFWLKSKDRMRQLNGGHKIVEQLLYAGSTATGSYANDDVLDTTHQGGISAAEYDWGQYFATVNVWGIEEAKNNGEEEIIDLLEAKIFQAEETITEDFDVMFLADGTGNGGKDWNGLDLLVGNTGVVGGIDSAAVGNEFWQSYVEDGDPVNGTVLTLPDLTTAFNTASRGNDSPDAIFTTQELFEAYEALLSPQLRFTDNKTADGGFQNLLFKTAPIMFDTNIAHDPVTGGTVFFVNSKYLRLVGHKQRWFSPTPFVRPENQDVRIAQILCYGQLTTSNRARQARLNNRIAA